MANAAPARLTNFGISNPDSPNPQAGQTNGFVDSLGNQINSGAKSTFSTITATNHNYNGNGVTPTYVGLNQQTGTATVAACGTITATQYTPTGGVSATWVAETKVI